MAIMPIGRIFEWQAARDPDRPCLTFEGETLSRLAFDRLTNRLARAYAGLGVGQDDFVTIALPNGIEFYAAAVASWKLGATPQPVSAKLPPAELDAIIELVRPKLTVGVPKGVQVAGQSLPPGFVPDPDLSDAPLPERVARHWKAPTSGGSTGRPKIIVAAAPGLFDPAQPGARMQPDGAHLVPGPLYHNGPFVMSCQALFSGSHVVVMPRFDAEQTLALIARHHIDWVMMVPTMMHRIWRLGPEIRGKYDLSSLRVLLHLAAPCPAWLKEEWINWIGPQKIHELYAGTEGTGMTWIVGDEWLAHRGSVGRPQPGCEMIVVDGEGAPLPAGEVGEIYIRPASGQGSTYHYLGDQAKALEGGWESLGDMGYFDADGYLYLADRLTDMILSGGANIYPAEVEAAIDAHPAVRSSAVIGLPDDDMGNLVHAIVDCTAPIDEAALRATLADRLVKYKIPRSFEFVNTPLRDDAGKVRRKALREERLARMAPGAERT